MLGIRYVRSNIAVEIYFDIFIYGMEKLINLIFKLFCF